MPLHILYSIYRTCFLLHTKWPSCNIYLITCNGNHEPGAHMLTHNVQLFRMTTPVYTAQSKEMDGNCTWWTNHIAKSWTLEPSVSPRCVHVLRHVQVHLNCTTHINPQPTDRYRAENELLVVTCENTQVEKWPCMCAWQKRNLFFK